MEHREASLFPKVCLSRMKWLPAARYIKAYVINIRLAFCVEGIAANVAEIYGQLIQ
jgi:hypothetical protein